MGGLGGYAHAACLFCCLSSSLVPPSSSSSSLYVCRVICTKSVGIDLSPFSLPGRRETARRSVGPLTCVCAVFPLLSSSHSAFLESKLCMTFCWLSHVANTVE